MYKSWFQRQKEVNSPFHLAQGLVDGSRYVADTTDTKINTKLLTPDAEKKTDADGNPAEEGVKEGDINPLTNEPYTSAEITKIKLNEKL